MIYHLKNGLAGYTKIVNGNVEEVTTEQNYTTTIEEKNNEKLVKIDLKEKELNDLTLKIHYKIRVTNESNIPGYVKELTDYLPEGTEFFQEDNLDENGNPLWVLEDHVLKTTPAYKDKFDTLLKEGDAIEFDITLRWKVSTENMGLKNNIVEISKDYNDWQVPDKDSDPGNVEKRLASKNWEDDEDEVPFLLTVSTGEWIINVSIITLLLILILGISLYLRKKAYNII